MARSLRNLSVALLVCTIPLLAQNYGWTKVAQLPASLHTVFFIDSLHGWTAGTSAQIFKTIDGGSTWTPHASNVPFVVYAISFADTLNGWCVGSDGNGKIIHTTDGGETWVFQFENSERLYLGTHAFSKTKNLTVGLTQYSPTPDTGKIVATTSTGISWSEATPFDSIGSFGKIQFLDSLNGFILNSNTLYPNLRNLRTRNGGKTWSQLPPHAQIQVMTFLDTLRGWGGYMDDMYNTVDGGLTWQFQAYLDQPDQLSMQDIEFADSLNGWAFGSRFYMGTTVDDIFHTTDGGQIWYEEAVAVAQTHNYIEAAQMWNKHLGWAVCSDGSALKYGVLTSVAERIPGQQPKTFTLRQNYPNPFNPSTSIEYELQKRQTVTLILTDALGKHVETIVSHESQDAGVYRVRFDGSSLASGTYYYTLTTEAFTDTKQMILIK